jgi:hypothetical protein
VNTIPGPALELNTDNAAYCNRDLQDHIIPTMRTLTTSHWQIGNTGFRNPERLWALARVLLALDQPFRNEKGTIKAEDLRTAIAAAKSSDPEALRGLMGLGEHINTTGLQKGIKALETFGLLRPASACVGLTQDNLFTPLGLAFVKADTDRARRLAFAEALANMAPVDVRGSQGKMFARMADIWVELNARPGADPVLHRDELAWCVLPAPFEVTAREVVDNILAERVDRALRRREKKAAKASRETARTKALGLAVSVDSLREYADTTMRHLIYTGLFHPDSSLMNLRVDAFWMPVWEAIAAGETTLWSNKNLTKPLVTQLQQTLGKAATSRQPSLLSLLEARDQQAMAAHMLDPEVARCAGDMLAELAEPSRKHQVNWHDGSLFAMSELNVVPACTEWAATAVFVHAVARSGPVQPHEGWRGRADAQGRPERHAPGGNADAWVTGQLARWVVETTMLGGSRQEACEGESVRRHVAMHETCGRPVWGIFVAPDMDYNTLNTLAGGLFFEGRDAKEVRVIPLTIEQLNRLHRAELDEAAWVVLAQDIWASRPLDASARDLPGRWEENIALLVDRRTRPVSGPRGMN